MSFSDGMSLLDLVLTMIVSSSEILLSQVLTRESGCWDDLYCVEAMTGMGAFVAIDRVIGTTIDSSVGILAMTWTFGLGCGEDMLFNDELRSLGGARAIDEQSSEG